MSVVQDRRKDKDPTIKESLAAELLSFLLENKVAHIGNMLK
jgi:hypothetical protein